MLLIVQGAACPLGAHQHLRVSPRSPVSGLKTFLPGPASHPHPSSAFPAKDRNGCIITDGLGNDPGTSPSYGGPQGEVQWPQDLGDLRWEAPRDEVASWVGARSSCRRKTCPLPQQRAAWAGVGGHRGGTRLLMYFLAIAWTEGGEKCR